VVAVKSFSAHQYEVSTLLLRLVQQVGERDRCPSVEDHHHL